MKFVYLKSRPVWGTPDKITGRARCVVLRLGFLRLSIEVWTRRAEQ